MTVKQIAAPIMLESHLSIRLPELEMKILEQYCHKYQRTKTDVVREFIRSLNQKL
ncbi:CopG family transcriptional regulator [Aliterella atlantica]|uniref:CopG family transcriptional regulator n=1 Tax=Aliterella atlantica TaxID=1827278 RepID=UPI0030DA2140